MSSNADNVSKIYMDYNATTPLAKEVITSIAESLVSDWGNPSSGHSYGAKSKKAVSHARNQIAEMLNVKSSQIIFTSGGTEANNMIIYGVLQYFKEFKSVNSNATNGKPHIITTNVEHDSVVLPIIQLQKLSVADCTIVEVNRRGVIDVDTLLSKITDNTCLITVMSANNETGVIMPISEIGERLVRINAERGIRKLIKIQFHSDAAQMIGKERVHADELKVDYLTIVGHKFYGPRIGCVWARGPLYPVFYGGGQERKIRPGTENTPMIVGLGMAAELVSLNIEKYKARMLSLRMQLESRLKEVFGDMMVVNCEETLRLPNTVNASFVGHSFEGSLILSNCKRLIASVGAACHGGVCSQILVNSGVSVQLARSAVRLSVGRDTTPEDIETVVLDLFEAVCNLNNKHSDN